MFYGKKNKRRLVSESGTTSYLEQRNNWRGPKKSNHQKDSRKFGFGIKEAYTSVCLLVCFLRGEGHGIAIVIIITIVIVIVIIVIAIARLAFAIAIVIAIVIAIA